MDDVAVQLPEGSSITVIQTGAGYLFQLYGHDVTVTLADQQNQGEDDAKEKAEV